MKKIIRKILFWAMPELCNGVQIFELHQELKKMQDKTLVDINTILEMLKTR